MSHRPKCICRTIKLLEDNTGENLGDLGFGITFKIEHQRHNPNRCQTSLKSISSTTQKTSLREREDKSQIGRKCLQNVYLIKGLVFRIYKELKPNNKKTNHPILKSKR